MPESLDLVPKAAPPPALEAQAKEAFEAKDWRRCVDLALRLHAEQPESQSAAKLLAQAEKALSRQLEAEKAKKIQEYESFLADFFKAGELEKMNVLLAELGQLDSSSKAFSKWSAKAHRLSLSKKGMLWWQRLFRSRPAAPSDLPVQPFPPPQPSRPPVSVGPSKGLSLAAVPLGDAPVPFSASEKQSAASPSEGNLFTRMFSSSKVDPRKQSIIDVIVDKAAQEKAEKKAQVARGSDEKAARRLKQARFARFAGAFAHFAILFVALSAGFLYVNIVDEKNMVLGLANIPENKASRLHAAASSLDESRQKEQALRRDIERFEKGYSDRHQQVVQSIVAARLNWPDVLAKINEVANSVYELNDFFQYIQFSGFGFNADTKQISLTGSLSDPAGKNLTRLVELEEAFKHYPSDPSLPNDPAKPYFKDFQESQSYSKSFAANEDSVVSRFSMSFKLNQ